MPNVYELEKHLVSDSTKVPQYVINQLGEDAEEEIKHYPIAFGYTKETGWYILMSGQGPFIFWMEKEQRIVQAENGRRIE